MIDVQVFTRDGVEKDKRALQIEEEQLAGVKKDLYDQMRIMENDIYHRLERLLVGKVADGGRKPTSKTPLHTMFLRPSPDIRTFVHSHSHSPPVVSCRRPYLPPS